VILRSDGGFPEYSTGNILTLPGETLDLSADGTYLVNYRGYDDAATFKGEQAPVPL